MPGSREVAEKLLPLPQDYNPDKTTMVSGHGNFAVGRMLEEAFQATSSLEAPGRALYLHRPLSPRDIKEGEGRW